MGTDGQEIRHVLDGPPGDDLEPVGGEGVNDTRLLDGEDLKRGKTKGERRKFVIPGGQTGERAALALGKST